MTFYQELQLNQAGSKALIKASKSKKEKYRHIAVYLFKILLTVAFCTAFVMAFGAVFGEDNNIVGVVMLLCVLSFRYADLGIKNKDAMWAFAVIFAILAAGPRLANACGLVAECMIHIVCIMAIMILSCHNVLMFNHATLVLGYLLLYGYDVTGEAYLYRLVAIAAGAALTMAVYYRNHRKRTFKRTFKDLFKEVDFQSSRTQWQLRGNPSSAAPYVGRHCSDVSNTAVPGRNQGTCRGKNPRQYHRRTGIYINLLFCSEVPSFIYRDIWWNRCGTVSHLRLAGGV